MITLSIIDDHSLFRVCLKCYLSKQENIEVDLDEGDPEMLLTKLKNSRTSILLTDLSLPKISGDELVKTVKDKFPHIKIIIVSVSRELFQISELIDLGIHSYISKTDDIEDLLRAIYAVNENRIFKNALFTDALYWRNRKSNTKQGCLMKVDFSDREKRIIQLLWEEKSNREISNEMFLGIRSIEKIRQNLKEKIGVKTIIGLLKFAIEMKIIKDEKNKIAIS